MPAGNKSPGPRATKKRLKLLFIVLLSSISLTASGGYCCLMSDMEIVFGEQGAERILMEQPVLLSFAVSS